MTHKLEELNAMLNGGMEVYRHYYYSVVGREIARLNDKCLSPFPRANGKIEEDPSFSIYFHKSKGTVFFKDHGLDMMGSHWQFVMNLFGLDFKDAVEKVKSEILGIGSNTHIPIRKIFYKPIEKKSTRVEITPLWREWQDNDLKFFERFNISEKTLNKFNCCPLEGYDLLKENKTIRIFQREDDPIYCFTFPSGRHKIYRPLTENQAFKWTSNLVAEEDFFGFHMVPKKCEHLFLIGGNKDAMSFYENIGYPVMALASESTNLTDSTITILRHTATNIWVLYDNDTQGYRKAEKFKEQFGLQSLNHLLEPYQVKDFAELVEKHPDKVEDFKNFLNQHINI